jgi:hypothetical protein
MAKVIAMYKKPADVAAFEKRYRGRTLAKKIRLRRYEEQRPGEYAGGPSPITSWRS